MKPMIERISSTQVADWCEKKVPLEMKNDNGTPNFGRKGKMSKGKNVEKNIRQMSNVKMSKGK